MVIHISDQLHIVIMISSGGRIQPIRTEALKMFYCWCSGYGAQDIMRELRPPIDKGEEDV
jgi:hypothetical protein